MGIFLFFLSEYHIMSLNPLRTYIAINIFLIGIYYIELNNRKILGSIIMLLGVLFHFLAIGGIIVYLIFKLFKVLRVKKIINYILLLLPLIDFTPVLHIMTRVFLPMYLRYFGSYFDQPLSLLNIIRYYVIVLLFLILKKYLNFKDGKEKIILQGMYIFLLLMGMAAHFGELHRVAYFYKIFELIFFVYILEKKKLEKKKYLKNLIVIVFLINYIGIFYVDMGALRFMEIRKIHIFNKKNNSYYLEEIKNYLNKRRVYKKKLEV